MLSSGFFEAMLARGQLVNYCQPVVDPRSGVVIGIETLGRLVDQGKIVPPGEFLPVLNDHALDRLLFSSVPQGLAMLARCARQSPGLRISFNVSPITIMRPHFGPRFLQLVDSFGIERRRVTLELLEGDEFPDATAPQLLLSQLRTKGLRIAFDDVGSGYSSLMRLQAMPADTIKLEQAFVRGLGSRPEDLHFVKAMMALSRGMQKFLIVEGVETPEIFDALAILGVEATQGYAIARPMPEPALLKWLADHRPEPARREPRSLLGAYAMHVGLVRGVPRFAEPAERSELAVGHPRSPWLPDRAIFRRTRHA